MCLINVYATMHAMYSVNTKTSMFGYHLLSARSLYSRENEIGKNIRLPYFLLIFFCSLSVFIFDQNLNNKKKMIYFSYDHVLRTIFFPLMDKLVTKCDVMKMISYRTKRNELSRETKYLFEL